MIRNFLKTTALGLCLAGSSAFSAGALDLATMTDAERADFGEAVREYLLENPQVIMDAVAILQEREQQQEAAQDVDLIAANLDALHNDGFSWQGGNPDGDITVVEFLDYRCGYCKRAHPEVKAMIEADPNIRLIVKEYPILGDESVLASRFAIAVKQLHGDEAYQNVSDAMMAMRGAVNEASLTRIASEFGHDMAAIAVQMESEDVATAIRDTRLLGQRMQISGTPSFVIGDHMLRGYLPLDGMQQIVADQRDEG
ncbi:DsbA family protein [Halocynthiibacter namhaensis]|uniref:DsbA family protein n=1 Tax=Halocynthiibacter namhaensis TaxID=1290553 RepID=UPI000579938F|nr:DsbA family protein [Halocynthiibacter namhaensis]